MEQRISFVTLAVRDLDASRACYLDGLGWRADVGPIAAGLGLAPFTLAHDVATPAEVDAVLGLARSAGADPDGVRWEIAHHPGEIGRVVRP